jgi:hypothetical protein
MLSLFALTASIAVALASSAVNLVFSAIYSSLICLNRDKNMRILPEISKAIPVTIFIIDGLVLKTRIYKPINKLNPPFPVPVVKK